MDSNHRRHSRQIYSLLPLATRATLRKCYTFTIRSRCPDAFKASSWRSSIGFELARGLEPRTPCLQNRCSTVELRQPEPETPGTFAARRVNDDLASAQAKLAPPRENLPLAVRLLGWGIRREVGGDGSGGPAEGGTAWYRSFALSSSICAADGSPGSWQRSWAAYGGVLATTAGAGAPFRQGVLLGVSWDLLFQQGPRGPAPALSPCTAAREMLAFARSSARSRSLFRRARARSIQALASPVRSPSMRVCSIMLEALSREARGSEGAWLLGTAASSRSVSAAGGAGWPSRRVEALVELADAVAAHRGPMRRRSCAWRRSRRSVRRGALGIGLRARRRSSAERGRTRSRSLRMLVAPRRARNRSRDLDRQLASFAESQRVDDVASLGDEPLGRVGIADLDHARAPSRRKPRAARDRTDRPRQENVGDRRQRLHCSRYACIRIARSPPHLPTSPAGHCFATCSKRAAPFSRSPACSHATPALNRARGAISWLGSTASLSSSKSGAASRPFSARRSARAQANFWLGGSSSWGVMSTGEATTTGEAAARGWHMPPATRHNRCRESARHEPECARVHA